MKVWLTCSALLLTSTAMAAPDKEPNWLRHELFWETTQDGQTLLYGVGSHALSRTCRSMWRAQAISFAKTKGRTAIAEFLGKATGGTSHRIGESTTVIESEVIRLAKDNKRRDTTKTEVTIDETSASMTTHKEVQRGLAGVVTLKAWFDVKTKTFYALSAKVVLPKELPISTLPRLPPKGGQTMRGAELSMAAVCD